jgi:hypothetical protein
MYKHLMHMEIQESKFEFEQFVRVKRHTTLRRPHSDEAVTIARHQLIVLLIEVERSDTCTTPAHQTVETVRSGRRKHEGGVRLLPRRAARFARSSSFSACRHTQHPHTHVSSVEARPGERREGSGGLTGPGSGAILPRHSPVRMLDKLMLASPSPSSAPTASHAISTAQDRREATATATATERERQRQT